MSRPNPLDPARMHAVAPGDPPWPKRPDGWRHDFPDPPLAFPVPFGPLDGLALVGWTIIAQFLVLVPLLGAGAELTGRPVAGLVTVLVIYVVTLVGVAGYLRARAAFSWRLLGPVRPRVGHVGQGLVWGVVGWLGVTGLLLLLLTVFGVTDVGTQDVLDQARTGRTAAVLSVLVVGGVGPLAEEVIFRGVVFQSVRRRLGLVPGMVVSSALWTGVHAELYGDPVLLLGLFAFGLWLAWSMHRSGSLLVPLVAHSAFNVVQIAIALG